MPSDASIKKKPKLADISRVHPTMAEHDAVIEAMLASASSPIVTVTLGASMVEVELEKALRKRFARSDDETWGRLTSDIGPLNTFHQKIETAYALKIVDEKLRDDLVLIRKVRNAFAHTRRMIDFDEEAVAVEVNKFKTAVRPRPKKPRELFELVCLKVIIRLIKRNTRLIDKATQRLRRKTRPFRSLSEIANDYYERNPQVLRGLYGLGLPGPRPSGPMTLGAAPQRQGLLGPPLEPSSETGKK
jgi:hypothetical protein